MGVELENACEMVHKLCRSCRTERFIEVNATAGTLMVPSGLDDTDGITGRASDFLMSAATLVGTTDGPIDRSGIVLLWTYSTEYL